jgi:hypothetical protein
MRRELAVVLLAALPVSALALDKDKAMYAGGTASALPEKTEGRMDTSDPERMVFRVDKSNASLSIPWATVQSIEYGQRASRRWKSAILLSPVAIFAKSRKHYVTVTYKDAQGVDQAAVFELGKETFRPVLAALKARSRAALVCQDAEAAKQMGGACTVGETDAGGAGTPRPVP